MLILWSAFFGFIFLYVCLAYFLPVYVCICVFMSPYFVVCAFTSMLVSAFFCMCTDFFNCVLVLAR